MAISEIHLYKRCRLLLFTIKNKSKLSFKKIELIKLRLDIQEIKEKW